MRARPKRLTWSIAMLWATLAAAVPPGHAIGARHRELRYVVVILRHGVRSPTWNAARLRPYASEPWPDFGVPPGNLTPRGGRLIGILGKYYRQRFAASGLLSAPGCGDAGAIYIRADDEQRTVATGRALADGLAPGCGLAVHTVAAGKDPLFSGVGRLDPEQAAAAVRARLAPSPAAYLGGLHSALQTLQTVLTGGGPAPHSQIESGKIVVTPGAKGAILGGPLSPGSTLSEDLLLEYADGLPSPGWGRLNAANLREILEVHTAYADLTRRTPAIAAARGSNLLAHILDSLRQAASGQAVPGALGSPATRLLVLVGHDTNQSNLAGMLGVHWAIAGYPDDDTPPGGAILISLWKTASGADQAGLDYVAATPNQLRHAVEFNSDQPPPDAALALPSCPATREAACAWSQFSAILARTIAPSHVRH